MSLTRALSERQLARVALRHARAGLRVLVAGGSRRGGGSEDALLPHLSGSRVVAIDLNTGRRPDIAGDLTRGWPFGAGTFDLIISTWVLEHLADPRRFFEEAAHTLRAGGVLILAVPFLFRTHGSPQDYWRLTDTAIVHLGRAAGFDAVEVHPVGGAPFLSAAALLWPLLGWPLIGALAAAVAWSLDKLLEVASRLLRGGRSLLTSYPLAYVAILSRR